MNVSGVNDSASKRTKKNNHLDDRGQKKFKKVNRLRGRRDAEELVRRGPHHRPGLRREG